ncbi:MAG: hypothetical protein HC825_06460 [Oscillatoriales cyanobacterium RM1_1_9]|nr:hypothetical protein [Oscillatoriales cyanobacterium SM2_3_0]NJO46802.1 hypothetical protein [Oscillatoriales cyanobacterium RM2_1_1]NJO71419.1 hypothetical protein [Oscillatoriales cyanobacterium RM1_1_9]
MYGTNETDQIAIQKDTRSLETYITLVHALKCIEADIKKLKPEVEKFLMDNGTTIIRGHRLEICSRVKYDYSDELNEFEREIRAAKRLEVKLQIAYIENVTDYIRVTEVKKS